MAGTGRPVGRPPGSKNKKPSRQPSESAPKSAHSSSGGPTPASSNVPSKQPSTTLPPLPRSTLPPSVLATLERPSVSNFIRNHSIITNSEVHKKDFIKDVKEFARSKEIGADFVDACVGDAKKWLRQSREALKEKEPADGKKSKKHKKRDEPSAFTSRQETAVKQELPEEPSTEHKKSKKRKKDKTSEASASTQPEPVSRADDEKTSKKHKKKEKAPENAVDPASVETPVAIKSEESPTEAKEAKKSKKDKKPKTPRQDPAPEQRPTETPIPLPFMAKTEVRNDREDGARKLKSSKKRKREASDDGNSKPAFEEAPVPDVSMGSKNKKHSKSGREPESTTPDGKKAKKEKKHKSQPAARSPSPPPRKKTKRERKDGETTHLASKAQDSSHKSHEHADKGKDKKDKKAKSEQKHATSEDSRPRPSKTTARERETESEGPRDEQPTAHTPDDAPTPRASKKKKKKQKREKRQSELLRTQSAQPSNELEVDDESRKPAADSEVQSGKKSKKSKRRKSLAAPEEPAALAIPEAQTSPAKPSSSNAVLGTQDCGSATSRPQPPPVKRKRSPSPPSSPPPFEGTRQDKGRKLSLASTTSVFSLPAFTRFVNDTHVLPEPPTSLNAAGRKRWRKKVRRSLQKMSDETRAEISSIIDSAHRKPHGGGKMTANSDCESNSGRKLSKKRARVEQKVDPEDDATSKAAVESEKEQGLASEQVAVPQPTPKKAKITATGSFAHDGPLPKISSPEKPRSTYEASAAPSAPVAPESPLKYDLQGWDALPAQYVSESEHEDQDAIDLEADTPTSLPQTSLPQQAAEDDAESESTESESETESESSSESEAEALPPPKLLQSNLPKTPSQVAGSSQRSFHATFSQFASLRAQPLLSMSQLKESTPTLSLTRGGIPPKPKTPPKANGSVEILGIALGSDESDDESSGSSSDSDSDDGDEGQKQVKAIDSKSTTSHVPSSQPSKPLAEPESHLQNASVQAAREPSAALNASPSKTDLPTTDVPHGPGAEDETVSESSDNGSDEEEAANTNDEKLFSPESRSSEATRGLAKSPKKPLPKSSEPIRHDMGRENKSHESGDQNASIASESDGEPEGKLTTKNQEPVPSQVQSPQQKNSDSPRTSSQALKSPNKIPLRPLSKTDESPKVTAEATSSSEPAEHPTINDSIDTSAHPLPVGETGNEIGERGDPESPKSQDFRTSPLVERVLSTPRRLRPQPHEEVDFQASHPSRPPTANDIINSVALLGLKNANSVEGDEPQAQEASTTNPEAQAPLTSQTPAVDEDIKAESLPDADGESLLLPENPNPGHDVSSDSEPSDPFIDTPSKPPSSSIKRALSPAAAVSIKNEESSMGQNESHVESDDGTGRKDGESSTHASPVANEVTIVHSDAPSSQPRLKNGRFGPLNGRKSQPKRKRDRKLDRRTVRVRSRTSILRELSIDPDAVNDEDAAVQPDDGSPRLTRGNRRNSQTMKTPEDASQTTSRIRSARLRSTTRVSYHEDYNLDESDDKDYKSEESVTKAAARKQTSARKKSIQTSLRKQSSSSSSSSSSSQPSRPTRSPSTESDGGLQVDTPMPRMSTFVGVFIPSSQGGVILASPRDVRDGRSAEQQDGNVVASTADAHQTNDVEPLEAKTRPSPLDAAREDEDSAAPADDDDDKKSVQGENRSQDEDAADDEPAPHDDDDDDSAIAGYESPPRPVFTVSFLGTQPTATEKDSASENEGADDVVPDTLRELSPVSEMGASALADDDYGDHPDRKKSPSPEKRDSGVDEGEKPHGASPRKVHIKRRVEIQVQDESEHESPSVNNDDQASEAPSRGSEYTVDEDPKGFLNEDGTVSGQATPRRKTGLRSIHFTPVNSTRSPPGTVSCLPFPPVTAPEFGLIQEKLYDDPIRLLIAVMLLNKTKGINAIPKFWELMAKYPTIPELVHANLSDLTEMLKPLGLQSRRANQLINLMRMWTIHPPAKGQRYRIMNYPFKGAHKDIPAGEVVSDADPRVAAYEVCHLPGVGGYALDSWRIFCRDRLRELADGYNGEGAGPDFEPEWKRVKPKDKELRAFLRWMWLRDGWIWDPETGEKRRASDDEATAEEMQKIRWDQEAGEEVWDTQGEEKEKAPSGPLSPKTTEKAEGKGLGDIAEDSSPNSPSFLVDDPSSQLVREHRTRASQSQSQQSEAQLLQEQERHLSLSQTHRSTNGRAQRTSKATTTTISTVEPATLPTRLRDFEKTATAATTSTSSTPVSAYRHKPTPLDPLGDDDSDFNLAGLFHTPHGYRNRRSSSAKWAARGIVDETPPGSPRGTQQNGGQQLDMDDFSVVGDEGTDRGVGNDRHREAGDDGHDHDDENLVVDGGRRGRPGSGSQPAAEGEQKQPSEQELPVDEPTGGGTASQESNKSCCVM